MVRPRRRWPTVGGRSRESRGAARIGFCTSARKRCTSSLVEVGSFARSRRRRILRRCRGSRIPGRSGGSGFLFPRKRDFSSSPRKRGSIWNLARSHMGPRFRGDDGVEAVADAIGAHAPPTKSVEAAAAPTRGFGAAAPPTRGFGAVACRTKASGLPPLLQKLRGCRPSYKSFGAAAPPTRASGCVAVRTCRSTPCTCGRCRTGRGRCGRGRSPCAPVRAG
jgi:hypothetical protein